MKVYCLFKLYGQGFFLENVYATLEDAKNSVPTMWSFSDPSNRWYSYPNVGHRIEEREVISGSTGEHQS